MLPIADRHAPYAAGVRDRLAAAGLRVELDDRQEKIGYKIREAQLQKVPYMLVVGDREMAEGTVSVRSRAAGDQGAAHRRGVHRAPPWTRSAARGESPGNSREALIAFDRFGPRREERTRVNERIRVREIRVIDDTGAAAGHHAAAAGAGARAIEGPGPGRGGGDGHASRSAASWTSGSTSTRSRSATREARKHQKVIEVKEIKFRPKVDEHDYLFKKKHIERFLADGDKVKATIFFRGREMAHPEIGRRILERLLRELVDEAVAENMPRKEGNTMHVILARKPGYKPPKPVARPAAAAGPAAARRRSPPTPRNSNRSPISSRSTKTIRATRPTEGRRGRLTPAAGAEKTSRARSASGRQEWNQVMPKLKTHRGAAKRFKKTATGKFVRNSAFKRHLASSKTTKRKRQLGKDECRLAGRRGDAGADAALQVGGSGLGFGIRPKAALPARSRRRSCGRRHGRGVLGHGDATPR